MAILATWDKQPAEVQDYDIDFSAWLAGFPDSVTSYTVAADTGITIDSHARSDGVVKVWLSGGTHGTTYKITATITTDGGRVKEDEIKIRVKET